MLSMSISRPSFVNEQVNWESASLSPHPPAVVPGGVSIVMSTATGQSRGARDRGRSAFELCESTAGIHT